MAKLYLRRTITGFEPADGPSEEIWKRYKLKEVYRADVVKPRNYGFHCLCFVLLTKTFENQEMYGPEQFNLFRKMIAMEAGHVEFITTLDGDIVPQAKSLSYDELDDVEFEALFPKLMAVCARMLKITDDKDIQALRAEIVQHAMDHYGYQP